MPTSTFRRAAAALVLAAALVAPWASAAENRAHREPHRTEASVPLAQRVFGFFWSTLVSIWGEDGCTIDPNGLTGPSTCQPHGGLAAQADDGCTIDPSGVTVCGNRALTSRPSEGGCTIDPNGRCHR